MYCEPCGAERLGHARFCAVCGAKTIERDERALVDDLARVRWLLSELPQWDAASVPQTARVYVDKRYRYIEKVLASSLEERRAKVAQTTSTIPSPETGEGGRRPGEGDLPKPPKQPQPALIIPPPPPPAPKPALIIPPPAKHQRPKIDPSSALRAPSPVSGEGSAPHPLPKGEKIRARAVRHERAEGVPGAVLNAKPPRRSLEDRVASAASNWHNVWKPFLNESIGWFVGGFLILAGTLYLVSDSWASMGSGLRAGVVFGLAAGWTLGFAAWGRFLSRREKTRGAARVLKLISAMMAPLAPLAIGPTMSSAWFIFVPATLAWAAFSALLARAVEPDFDAGRSRTLPLAMGLATAMMGLAPLAMSVATAMTDLAPRLLGLHVAPAALLWLDLLPVGLLVVHSGRERKTVAQRAFGFAAMAFAALLFAARLHLELSSAVVIEASAYAPFVALSAIALVRMRTPGHAADVMSVLAVALQVSALGIGVFIAPPGFFIAAAAGAWTCWTLNRERLSHSHRWLYGAYGFGYFAWQSCGQLVPGAVKQLVVHLREALGYSAQAQLPPSYDAAYAAVFIIAVGIFAVRSLARSNGVRKLEAEALLRCTWVTSLLAGALGMSALGTDVRPALFSVPFLAAFEVWLGLKLDRPTHSRVGAALLFAASMAAGVGAHEHQALVVAALALATAALSIPWTKDHRLALGLSSALQVTVAVAVVATTPASLSSTLALTLAGLAAVLVSLNLEKQGLWPAAGILLAVPPRLLLVLAPQFAPLSLALAAVAAAALVHRKGKWELVALPSAIAAGVAVLWQMDLQGNHGPILFGPVALISALALVLGALRDEARATEAAVRDTFAMVLLGASLLAGHGLLQAWPGLTPEVSSGLGAAVALAASLWSVRRPHWRARVLAVVGICVSLSAMAIGLLSHDAHVTALGLGAALLLSTRALTPALTLPLASASLMAVSEQLGWMFGLASVFTAVALMRELRVGRALSGPRRKFGASASLAALLPAMFVFSRVAETYGHVGLQTLPLLSMAVVTALLPLAWVRATRAPAWVMAAPPLALAAMLPMAAFGNVVLAFAVVALTRLLRFDSVRRVFFPERAPFGATDSAPRAEWMSRFMLGSLALSGLVWRLESPWAALPLALALVFAAADGLAVRLVLATLLTGLMPEALPYAALALVALSFATRHAPNVSELLLGTTPSPRGEGAAERRMRGAPQTAALLAVAAAGLHCVLMPAGALVPSMLLAFTLLAAGVTLGFGALVFASALAAVMLPNWNGATLELSTATVAVTVLAALAGVLRYPPLSTHVDALVAKLGRPLERTFPFWLWLAGAVGVTVLGALASPELCMALLLPAGLLLATPDPRESTVSIALLATLIVFRVPAPLSVALLSGGALALQLGARHRDGVFFGRPLTRPFGAPSPMGEGLSVAWTWAARVMSLVAVVPAVLEVGAAPGAVVPQLTLAAALMVAAWVCRVGALATFSALAAVVLPAFDGRAVSLGWLVPAASVTALVAALLRLPVVARAVERAQDFVAPQLPGALAKWNRPLAFWLWLGAALAVCAGIASWQTDYLALLLPAALLLATDVALESAAAFGILAMLVFFRAPAPLAVAVLSGSALALQLGTRHRHWVPFGRSLSGPDGHPLPTGEGLVRAWTWTARVLSVLALGPALLHVVQSPLGALTPALTLAAALLCAALVLGAGPLFTLAALATVALPALSGDGVRLEWLAPAATLVALLAALLRLPLVAKTVNAARAFVATPLDTMTATWLWLAAAAAVALGAVSPQDSHLMLLLPAALLLITETTEETAGAIALLAALLGFRVEAPMSGALLAGLGLAFSFGGRRAESARAHTWFHAGWVLTLVALPFANVLSSPLTPLTWALATGTAWVVASQQPRLEPLGWLASLAAGHVTLFCLGIRFSTGAPHQLILPWVASLSLLTGTLAMVLGRRHELRTRIGELAIAFGLCELTLGLGLLPGAHLREAVVVCVALVIASGPLLMRAGRRDDPLAAALSGLVPAMLLLAVHLVGLGGRLGSFEAFAALVLGVIASGLYDVLARAQKKSAARVALVYSFLWPLAGLIAAPHEAGWTLASLLLAQSLHFAWFGNRTGQKLPAVAAAVAFNAAMACGWLTTGFHSWEYLAIPFGLSLLGLVRVFSDELSEGTRVKLRAVAVTMVYAAASIRPLTFDHAFGLFVCVLVCVIGVGAGVALKVRSYVYLGTAFMVTSVVANLVRFGVREPRVGAIFLSSLGLLVVGFMVLVTTRRAELLEKFRAARAMLAQWDG